MVLQTSLQRTSLRTRLILGAAISVIVILVPIYVLDMTLAHQQHKSRLGSHADLSSELLSQTLVGPLWDFNYSLLAEFFQSFALDRLIANAELQDSSGEIIASYEANTKPPQSHLDIVIETPILQTIGDKEEVLGVLSMTFSGAQAESDLFEIAKGKLMSLVAILLLSILALYLVLGSILVPIHKLVAAISFIREGKLDRRVPGINRSDEIGEVANALEQLRLAETQMLAMRQEQDFESQRERHRLVRALESTADGVLVFDEQDRIAMQNGRAAGYFADVKKGQTVCPKILLNSYENAEAVFDLSPSERLVQVANADKMFDLRVRVDPILDEGGSRLGHVLLASDVTEQLHQKRRADFLARHDSLTGLANRRIMDEELAKPIDEPIALLLGDLDKFKHVNDRFGHPVGDGLLCRIADYLQVASAEGAVPLRLGGDEFGLLLKGLGSAERLKEIGEKAIERFSEPITINGRKVSAGLSFGLAECPGDTDRLTELPSLADLALYQAKAAGGGLLKVFRNSLKDDHQRRLRLESELTASFSNGNQPWPVFQRQTDPRTGITIGYEALARWKDSREELVSPIEFIKIAEESGVIRDLTREILHQSLKFACQVREQGFSGRVAVNLSPAVFSTEAAEIVSTALQETGCDGSLLEIEITEEILIADNTDATKQIKTLQEMGVTVALDDFGIGYSSLGYLKHFPVNKIKIDRSFVEDITESEKTFFIVQFIVSLAHALGVTVTAEGAETSFDKERLVHCGVDSIQGWVDGKPELAEQSIQNFGLVA